jgi:hypothetical protein
VPFIEKSDGPSSGADLLEDEGGSQGALSHSSL